MELTIQELQDYLEQHKADTESSLESENKENLRRWKNKMVDRLDSYLDMVISEIWETWGSEIQTLIKDRLTQPDVKVASVKIADKPKKTNPKK